MAEIQIPPGDQPGSQPCKTHSAAIPAAITGGGVPAPHSCAKTTCDEPPNTSDELNTTAEQQRQLGAHAAEKLGTGRIDRHRLNNGANEAAMLIDQAAKPSPR